VGPEDDLSVGGWQAAQTVEFVRALRAHLVEITAGGDGRTPTPSKPNLSPGLRLGQAGASSPEPAPSCRDDPAPTAVPKTLAYLHLFDIE
jgi:hypothetical protein